MSNGINEFEIARAAWLAAYAKWMECNQTEDEMSAASDAEGEAVWRFIQTPATRQCDLLQKAHFVQHLVNRTEEMGDPVDHRHIVALASLVADIARLP
jgi:hypothetical protein